MGKRTYLSEEELEAVRLALNDGMPDRVFKDLAVYLERNAFKLSDDVLRLYAEKELFDCFSGRGQQFADLISR